MHLERNRTSFYLFIPGLKRTHENDADIPFLGCCGKQSKCRLKGDHLCF